MNDEPIAIRRAQMSDAETLAVLATHVWLDTYAAGGVHPAVARYVLDTFAPSRYRDLLVDPAMLVLVAGKGRHTIGLAIVALGRKTPHSPAARQAEIDRLYVQEPFCNAGIGARLIAAVEDALTGLAIDAVWLETWAKNERALRFYTRQAYADVGTAYFELDGEPHENRVLVKRLGGSS